MHAKHEIYQYPTYATRCNLQTNPVRRRVHLCTNRMPCTLSATSPQEELRHTATPAWSALEQHSGHVYESLDKVPICSTLPHARATKIVSSGAVVHIAQRTCDTFANMQRQPPPSASPTPQPTHRPTAPPQPRASPARALLIRRLTRPCSTAALAQPRPLCRTNRHLRRVNRRRCTDARLARHRQRLRLWRARTLPTT